MKREVLATVGVVVFCIIGAVVTYWVVNGGGGAPAEEVEEVAPGETEARANFGLGRG